MRSRRTRSEELEGLVCLLEGFAALGFGWRDEGCRYAKLVCCVVVV